MCALPLRSPEAPGLLSAGHCDLPGSNGPGIWTHWKAKAQMPKAVLQPTAPNEFIPGLLDGGVTHRLEATNFRLVLLFQEVLCVVG